MSKVKQGLVATAVAMACSGVVQAGPAFNAGESNIFFRNFENLYRSDAGCAAAPFLCLAPTAGDPPGFQRVSPFVAGNVFKDDVFIGILDVQNVTSNVSGLNTYDSAPGDRFTGYFVQLITAVAGPGLGHPTAHVTLGTTADPFGILVAGEMFRLYSDTPTFLTLGCPADSKDISCGIAAATAGTLWASLGLSAAPDGYAYTHTDLTLPGTGDTDTEAFLALDVITKGPGYSAGLLAKLNDFNETEIGGTSVSGGSQICTAAELASPTISCTDVVGTSEIEFNSTFGATGIGPSPWMTASNDPFDINRIPEPGALALVGLALAGLGASLRRRRSA